MGEAKPRLVWVAEHDDDSDYLSVMERLDTQGVYEGVTVCRLHDEAAADLIADAGTVFNTTGLTPSQLVERVNELEQTLSTIDGRLRQCFDDPITAREAYDSFYQEIVAAALSKARPNTAEGEPEAEATDGMRWNQTPCEHCGHTEGEHFNARCLHITGETRYTPAAAKEPSP